MLHSIDLSYSLTRQVLSLSPVRQVSYCCCNGAFYLLKLSGEAEGIMVQAVFTLAVTMVTVPRLKLS